MNTCKNLLLSILTLVLFNASPSALEGQGPAEAVAYMNVIDGQYQNIRNDTWDYTSTMAHSRSARKVEKKRADLMNTIQKSIQVVRHLPAFNNDISLRDSTLAYLKMNFYILNNDFAKIIDMEEVAEQSYDLMEAYLLAQQKAGEKLQAASSVIDEQYKSFAGRYGVNLIESHDHVTQNLEKANEALTYYNKIYLIFFKAYKQEAYLIDAMNKKEVSAIEQNRNALSVFSDEGLQKLDSIPNFKADNSLHTTCSKMLTFYKEEADQKIPVISDFMLTAAGYDKMVALFNAKDKKLLTQDEVNEYNNTLKEYKNGISQFNSTNNYLNSRRSSYTTSWNNCVNSFMARHIPQK